MTERGYGTLSVCLLVFAFVLALYSCAQAHDPLHAENNPWLNSLRATAGYVCCQNEEARHPVDWKHVDNERYAVIIKKDWEPVPDGAVVRTPNVIGYALVWLEPTGAIRCFLPGAEG